MNHYSIAFKKTRSTAAVITVIKMNREISVGYWHKSHECFSAFSAFIHAYMLCVYVGIRLPTYYLNTSFTSERPARRRVFTPFRVKSNLL